MHTKVCYTNEPSKRTLASPVYSCVKGNKDTVQQEGQENLTHN